MGDRALAVVGIGVRLPGGVSDWWSFLDTWRGLPDLLTAPSIARWPAEPGLIDRATLLEALPTLPGGWNGLREHEIERMDPVQRLLLACTEEALQDAALAPASLAGRRVGVWVGAGPSEWALRQPPDVLHDALGTYTALASGRLAHLLDTRGPAITVHTACSSGLVALAQAADALRQGQVELALVGAANVLTSPRAMRQLAALGALSPRGRCDTFSASADGYGRGEGAVVLVLARAGQAGRGMAPARGLILGAGVHQDGRTTQLTAPSQAAQAAVIRQALDDAQVSPAQVAAIEAHGTGTPIGDPIEVEALRQVFGDDGPPLYLGSVKTCWGHLEPASGLLGVLAGLGALSLNRPAPTRVPGEVNPRLRLEGSRFTLTAEQLFTPERPYLGVSSFGLSGTNAHVLLGPPPPPDQAPGPVQGWLPLSGPDAEAVRDLAARWARQASALGPAHLAAAWHGRRTGRWRAQVRLPSADLAGDLLRVQPASCPAVAGASLWIELPEASPVAYRAVLDTTQHLLERGFRPVAVGGLGAGEWIAAAVAGSLTWAEARQLGEQLDDDEARRALAAQLRPTAPQLTWISGMTGRPVGAWVHHPSWITRAQPPRRAEALAELAAAGPLLAIGRGPAEATTASLEPGALDEALAALWLRGVDLPPPLLGGSPESARAHLPPLPPPRAVSAPPIFQLSPTPVAPDPTVAYRAAGPDDLAAALESDARWITLDPADPLLAAALRGWVISEAGGRVGVIEGPGPGAAATPGALLRPADGALSAWQFQRVALDTAPVPRPGRWAVVGGTGHLGQALARGLLARGVSQLEVWSRRGDVPASLPGAVGRAVDWQDPVQRAAALAAAPLDGLVLAWGEVGGGPDLGRDLDQALTLAHAAREAAARCEVIAIGSVSAWLGLRDRPGYAARQAALAAAHGGRLRVVALGPVAGGGLVPRAEQAALTRTGLRPLPLEQVAVALDLAAREGGPFVLADLDETLLPLPRIGAADRAPWLPRLQALLASLIPSPEAGFDPDRGLFEQGLDSLGAAELAARLSAALGRPVPVATVFDHGTLRALARHLEGDAGPEQPTAPSSAAEEGVAILGVGLQLPGIDDFEGLVDQLAQGEPTITPVPRERWNPADWPGTPDAGSFLSGIELFDAAAFGLSEAEARALDPQQRLLLSTTRAALEDAGVSPDEAPSRVGVYLGIGRSEYGERFGPGHADFARWGTGNAASFAAGRLAHTFGWRGPALGVDTACSSGLVALHLAKEALRRGEIELAVVGAAQLSLSPQAVQWLATVQALSPTGRSRPFDAQADGYVRGEGAVVLVLGRPGRGAARALLLGSAVGHDGTASALTAPNGEAQEQVLRSAWQDARLDAPALGYLEAHGTGTPLGDPIEWGALARLTAARPTPLPISTLKARHGHLEVASGLAGVAQVLAAFQAGVFPGNPGLTEPNPHLSPAAGLRLLRRSEPWIGPRTAGVSSFGLSGTNAHVVVTAAPDVPPAPAAPALLLSAARSEALARAALRAPSPDGGAWLARRAGGRFRGARRGEQIEVRPVERPPRVALLFTGQGTPFAGRGRGLARWPAVQRRWSGLADFDPEVLLQGEAEPPEWAQPALVALALGALALLPGLEVVGVFGHSLGEIPAAFAANSLDLASAWALTRARAEAFRRHAPPGRMLALAVDEARARAALEGLPGADLAAVNGEEEVVLAGEEAALQEVLRRLGAPAATWLPTPHPFHGPGMEAAAAALSAAIVDPGARPQHPWYDHRGQRVGQRTASDWGAAVRRPVRFLDAIRALDADLYLEIGSRPVLSRLGAKIRPDRTFLPLLDADGDPTEGLTRLWLAGARWDLAATRPLPPGRRPPPTPLAPRRLWIEPERAQLPRWTLDWEPTDAGPATLVRAPDPLAAALTEAGVGVSETAPWTLIDGREAEVDQVLRAAAAAPSGVVLWAPGAFGASPRAAALEAVATVASLERPERPWRVIDAPLEALAGALAAPEDRVLGTPTGLFRLVLRALPTPAPRAPTGRWLILGGTGALGQELTRQLEARGVEVWTASRRPSVRGRHVVVDLRAPGAAEALLAQGPWDGIVQAAAMPADGLLDQRDAERWSQAWQVKVGVALALDAAFLGPLILVGSATALLGQVGQGAYAAANAALASLARSRRARGLPAVALGLGPLPVGLGARLAETPGASRLDPAAAARLVLEAGEGPPVQWIGHFDWAALAGSRVGPAPSWLAAWAPARPDRAGPAPDQGSAILEELRAVLGSDLPLDAPFFDYGLDSVGAVELARRLSSRLGRPVGPTVAFDHPSARRLVAALQGKAAEASARAPRGERGPLALVGLACRFAGVRSFEDFQAALTEASPRLGPPPDDRFSPDALPEDARPFARQGGFLDQIDQFDPLAFGLSPREAAAIDPQQRLLLTLAQEALEDAQLTETEGLGIFVGLAERGYLRRFHSPGQPTWPDPQAATGNEPSFAAGRLAHALDANGPAISLNTTCSSALSALALAVDALRQGRCRRALVGAAHLQLHPDETLALARLGALSPTGRCWPFEARADGYVRADGAALFVLEPLEDAKAAGRRIYAVVRGVAVNHDGRAAGLTVPHGPAQAAVLRAAWADAGLDPTQADYLETHGTGTPLGDPIEIGAVREVFQPTPERPLVLGAVKARLGHSEIAAGAAGLLAALSVLNRGIAPALPGFQTPNPHLDLRGLELPRAPRLLDARRAGVSSFGLSGTNVHVVLERIDPPATPPPATEQAGLYLLSAAHPAALSALARQIPRQPAGAIAAALAHGRPPRVVRAAVRLPEDAVLLDRLGAGEGAARAGAVQLAWVFTGQGSLWAGCHQGLLGRPGYAEALSELRPHLPFDPEQAWATAPGDPRVAQPALFAWQWALARILGALGLQPAWVAGHSLGEWTAAALAGALPLADALRGLLARAEAFRSLAGGSGMLALRCREEDLPPLPAELELAAKNHPEEVVVAGPIPALDAFEQRCRQEGLAPRRLAVEVGYHSRAVEPALAAWRPDLEALAFQPLRVPLITAEAGEERRRVDADHWLRHGRRPVRWEAVARALARAGATDALEVGPNLVLTGAGLRTAPSVRWWASARRGDRAGATLESSLGGLWAHGAELRVEGLVPRRPWYPLPPSPLVEQRCWLPGDQRALPAWTYQVTWQPVADQAPLGPVALLGSAPGWASALGAPEVRDLPGFLRSLREPTLLVDASFLDARSALEAVPTLASRIRTLVISGAPVRYRLLLRSATAAGGAAPDPVQAALRAALRVALLEHPELAGGSVDLEDPAPNLDGLRSTEEHPALRSGVVLGERLAPLPLAPGRAPLPPAVVVTGATGALARSAVAWLIQRGVGQVILVSRRELEPNQPAWRPAQEAEAERAGAQLRWVVAQDGDALAPHLPEGPLGLLHLAGSTDPRPVVEVNRASFQARSEPKVDLLREVLAAIGERLAFVVLPSSISAVWGSRDLADYAAANAQAAAIAAEVPHLVVDLGPIDGGGMMRRGDLDLLERMGLRRLAPSRVWEQVDALLAADVGRSVIADVRWEQFLPVYEAARPRPLVAPFRPAAPAAPTAPLAPVGRWVDALPAGPERERLLVQRLQEVAQRVLRLNDPPGAEVPLLDLGLDSLLATELKNELLKDGIDAPLGRLLGGPSLAELAAWCLPRLPGAAVSAPQVVRVEASEALPSWIVPSHVSALLVGAALAWVAGTVWRAFGG